MANHFSISALRTPLAMIISSVLNNGASLVAQTVKNLTAMMENQVRSLGGEDPLEKGMATH